MTRIVYAAPDYIPPRGVIVLPLEAHPAIQEDATLSAVYNRPMSARKIKPCRVDAPPSALAQKVYEWLKAHTDGTVAEIAAGVGKRKDAVHGVLYRHPELFEEAGERACQGTRPQVVWALVEDN